MTVNVRQPRVWLSVGGQRVPCLTATVTRKSEGAADTFSAELSIDQTAQYGMGLAEWADYQPVDCEILMSSQFGGGDETSMITGQIDEPHIHWQEMTVTVSGRDLSGSLTEKRRSEAFKNQTIGNVVTKVAQDHKLNPVIVDTGDYAGKIYDQDTVHLIMNLSDTEVLDKVAERAGARWYVEGSDLVFEPKGTQSGTVNVQWCPPGVQAAYGVATCTDLSTHRNMTAARPHKMSLNSWNHRDKKLYTSTAEADGVGDPVEVQHHHNGRTQDQVDKIPKARLKEAIRHDCNVVVKAPGDTSVTARQKLQLSGTGTIYDQLYDIDEVVFEIGWGTAFEMTIQGKIAKSGRSGSDDTGSDSFSSSSGSGGIGSDAVAAGTSIPSATPAGSGGIGRN